MCTMEKVTKGQRVKETKELGENEGELRHMRDGGTNTNRSKENNERTSERYSRRGEEGTARRERHERWDGKNHEVRYKREKERC